MLAQHFDVRRTCWVSAECFFVFVFVFSGCAGSLGLLHCYLGFFLVAVSRSHSLVVAHGLRIAVASRCKALALGCRGFSSCSAQIQLPSHIWNLSGPGIEPMIPSLAGRFLTTRTSEKSCHSLLRELCTSIATIHPYHDISNLLDPPIFNYPQAFILVFFLRFIQLDSKVLS